MLDISHDGVYDIGVATSLFSTMLNEFGATAVRLELQTLIIGLHEKQLIEFDSETQCQLDVLKAIDKCISQSVVKKTADS